MLRTNLATRPFYNARAVRIGIGMVVVTIAALSVFNVARIVTLNARNATLVNRAESAETHAAAWRDQAKATRDTLDKDAVGAALSAAREANLLIERRAFSWTDLFNRFEETLPPDVRITAVQPQVDNEGRMLVAVNVIARRIEDLDLFIEAMEGTGAFRGVLSRQEDLQDDGMLRSVIQGYYGPQPAGISPADPTPAPPDATPAVSGNEPASTPAPDAPGGAR